MECPYLKKITFEKISQLTIEDAQFDQLINIQQTSERLQTNKQKNNDRNGVIKQIFPSSDRVASLIFEDQQIPNEHVEPIRITAPNVHSIFDYDLKTSEDIKLAEIKLPKGFVFKNISNQEDQCEIPNQIETGSKISNPHVLDSKMGLVNQQILQFYGDIMLDSPKDKQNTFQCSLSKNILKISCCSKTKIFIQLFKADCKYQEQRNNGLIIDVKLKSTNKRIIIYFFSKSQKQAFKKVLQTMLEELELCDLEAHQIQRQQNETFSELDSLGFQAQRISLEQVKKIGDTFDIILFKNRNLISKFQRFFTNSDYDHTAMLLKTTDNELLMLQCTSNMGVAVYSFDSLLKISKDKYFYRLGIRRYMGERKSRQMAVLQSFVRQSIGKPYKFDPMYLIKECKKTQEGFFCSELVVQSLQKSGIMNGQIPGYKFLPKHLSSDSLNDYVVDGYFTQTIIIK